MITYRSPNSPLAATISDPSILVYLGIDKHGNLWSSVRDSGEWRLLEEDLISLALRGKVRELEIIRELQRWLEKQNEKTQ